MDPNKSRELEGRLLLWAIRVTMLAAACGMGIVAEVGRVRHNGLQQVVFYVLALMLVAGFAAAMSIRSERR